MPSNTTYNPPNINSFSKTALNAINPGVSSTVPAGTSINLDYTLTDDCLITGSWILTNNGNYGDTINFQIIDSSGIYGTPGAILNQFINNWYLPPIVNEQINVEYPAKIYAGLTLRVIYTSTGTNDVFLAINYKLHKVLI